MTSHHRLTVAALPLDIVSADPAANIENIKAYMPALPDSTDVIVLPELFSTGYIDDPLKAAGMAQTNHDDTMRDIKYLAETYNVAFCGSFLARTGATVCNRAFFIEPDGEAAFYDKRHLFCLSDEARVAAKGDSLPPVVRYRGFNITMAVCYDVRFPAWIRASAANSDILIIPANWPKKRAFAWLHLLQARAIENQIFVVGCNRSGNTRFGDFSNLSYIIDFKGATIGTGYQQPAAPACDAVDNTQIAKPYKGDDPIIAECPKADLTLFREKFPAWRDADEFGLML